MTCPDCGATAEDRHLTPLDTGPLTRAAEAVQAADRAYFAAHPGARRYLRRVSSAEVAGMQMVGDIPADATVHGSVEVVELAPGMRIRRLVDCVAVRG